MHVVEADQRSAPPARPLVAAVGTLIVATSLIQLANGFFTTLISLRVALEGFAPSTAGLVLSAYFAGFTLGAVRSDRIIARIGHIRAYAAFAGLVAAATVLMPLLVGPWWWLVLRALVGFGCAGLFVATESWLNAKAPAAMRGRVFAAYMVGTFVALAAGQLLVGRVDVAAAGAFNAITALFALALVLVSGTRAEAPRATPAAVPPYRELLHAAPVAVLCVALGGLITGAFYALIPAWMQGEGIPGQTTALFMFCAVVGGLAFQVPVGGLSDRVDRRRVLAGLGLGLAAAAVALDQLPRTLAMVLPVAALLGGFMSALYPVCVAHANDRMPADRVVAVSSALILLSGIGSIIGPLVGTRLMASYGIDGVLYLLAAAALAVALVAGGRSLFRAPAVRLRRPFAILTPQAGPLASEPTVEDA
jgi:MFS family permease